jgi:hypothetical protein
MIKGMCSEQNVLQLSIMTMTEIKYGKHRWGGGELFSLDEL